MPATAVIAPYVRTGGRCFGRKRPLTQIVMAKYVKYPAHHVISKGSASHEGCRMRPISGGINNMNHAPCWLGIQPWERRDFCLVLERVERSGRVDAAFAWLRLVETTAPDMPNAPVR